MKDIGTIFIALIMLAASASTCLAGGQKKLASENDRINYSVGYQIGGDFKRQGVDLNADLLVKGVRDAVTEAEPRMTEEEMQATLVELKKKILALQEQEQRLRREHYRGEDRGFLEKNAAAEGVVSLPSGLQYRVLKQGTGKKPGAADTVTVHYRGTLVNGTEFDSSYRKKEPATFALQGVIPGWREALPLMSEGSTWRIFIPSDLAFGERGPVAERAVIYEIELIAVRSAE